MAGRRSGLLRVLAATAVLAAALVWWAPPAGADRIRDLQWHLQYLNVARAHELSQGEGITVAVIDTGVDGTHPDLAGNVLPGVDAWAASHGQDAGDGWSDPDGHGTGMAGLIAAHGHGEGNARGALGIAPEAQIIPIRIPVELELGGPEMYRALTAAIDEALKRDADIISMSISGPSTEQIRPTTEAGKIVVVAAGNTTRGEDMTATPGSVAVGAVRSDGLIADVSVRGWVAPPPLDPPGSGSGQGGFIWLTAPGQDITIPFTAGEYATAAGTSASTAIVSGAAALVWSRYPDLTASEVVRHLVATTTDKGTPGPNVEYGYGDLDLVRALETEPALPVTTATTAPTTGCDACTPGTRPAQEVAATPERARDGSGPDQTTLVLAGAAILAAAGLALVRVSRRRHRPALAGPDSAFAPPVLFQPPPGPCWCRLRKARPQRHTAPGRRGPSPRRWW